MKTASVKLTLESISIGPSFDDIMLCVVTIIMIFFFCLITIIMLLLLFCLVLSSRSYSGFFYDVFVSNEKHPGQIVLVLKQSIPNYHSHSFFTLTFVLRPSQRRTATTNFSAPLLSFAFVCYETCFWVQVALMGSVAVGSWLKVFCSVPKYHFLLRLFSIILIARRVNRFLVYNPNSPA